MTGYRAPLRDMLFVAKDVLAYEQHYRHVGAAEATPETVDAILGEAGRFCEQIVAPLLKAGDDGCRFADGKVTTPAGFRDAYRQYVEAGWPSLAGPVQYGGQGLPESLSAMVSEMFASANLAWFEYPGLCEGAISTLLDHGTESLRRAYLPQLISGEWLATMCLTEPQCGSDLGLIRTSAVDREDGDYELSGTKIFITSGEHDLTDNIVHIVLARLAGAPPGVRGISLFLVPKRLADGSSNGVHCGSIEHKMGLRGSATTVLHFDKARGYLIGQPNAGLKCMFTFMNAARIGAARLGVAVADRSFQLALAYARERLALRALSGPACPEKPADPIIVHADVRRMLLTQKAIAEGGRAFIYYLQQQADLARHSPLEDERRVAERLLGLLTPIAKGVLTELGVEAANHGIQVFGGHGFIAENAVEQIARDARITTIWEGTTGIQALDLLGRKILGSDGMALADMTDRITTYCEAHGENQELLRFTGALRRLVTEWKQLTRTLLERARSDREEIGAASVDYLMYSGYVVLGYFWGLMAATALRKLSGPDPDRGFHEAKLGCANFYFDRLLPRTGMHLQCMLSGAASVMTMSEAQFGS